MHSMLVLVVIGCQYCLALSLKSVRTAIPTYPTRLHWLHRLHRHKSAIASNINQSLPVVCLQTSLGLQDDAPLPMNEAVVVTLHHNALSSQLACKHVWHSDVDLGRWRKSTLQQDCAHVVARETSGISEPLLVSSIFQRHHSKSSQSWEIKVNSAWLLAWWPWPLEGFWFSWNADPGHALLYCSRNLVSISLSANSHSVFVAPSLQYFSACGFSGLAFEVGLELAHASSAASSSGITPTIPGKCMKKTPEKVGSSWNARFSVNGLTVDSQQSVLQSVSQCTIHCQGMPVRLHAVHCTQFSSTETNLTSSTQVL